MLLSPPDASQLDPVREILLVRMTALGDIVHCLPALSALKQHWPEAEVDWVCEENFAPLLEGHPALREVIPVSRKKLKRTIRSNPLAAIKKLWIGAKRLRKRRYDLILDLQGNLRSRAVALATRHQLRLTHHRSEIREYPWLLPGQTARTPSGLVSRSDKYLHLVRELGWQGATAEAAFPSVEAERSELAAQISDRTIALLPFASQRGSIKAWRLPHYSRLAESLCARGFNVVAVWAPSELDQARALVEMSQGAITLAPEASDLRRLLALLSQVQVAVGADTGPIHLAAALGRPTVALFGPKSTEIYRPYGPRVRVLTSGIPCSPCGGRYCDHTFCMEALSPERVLACIEELLSTEPGVSAK